ncbi:S-adenosylmethionine decarboxylase [Candidatus Woesearchaeota archaeon]|nr:S-adenosylmethionine decarboxylase [Candidatus Woesearchaeota archaeon]
MYSKFKGLGHGVHLVLYSPDKQYLENHFELSSAGRMCLIEEGYDIIKEASHMFESPQNHPAGFTDIKIIGESDEEIHTWPEDDSIQFHISTCRGPNSGWIAAKYFTRLMAPRQGAYFFSGSIPTRREYAAEAVDSIKSGFFPDVEEFYSAIDGYVEKCYYEMQKRLSL